MLNPLLQLGLQPDLQFEIRRRVKLLNGMCLAALGAVLLFSVYDIATQGRLSTYLYAVHGLAVATSAYVLWRHAVGDLVWTPAVAVIGFTATSALGSFMTGVPQSGRYYLIVIAISAFYLYRNRWLVLALFVVPALLFAFLDMEMTVIPRDLMRYGIFFGMLYASVGMLTWENQRYIDRSLSQRDALARQDEELRRRSEHLSALNEDLETSLDTVSLQLEALRTQSERLVALNRIKDRIVSVMGHDLKSPLASLDTLLMAVADQTLTIYEVHVLLPDVQKHLRATQEQLDDVLQWATAMMHDDANEAACADLYSVTARAVAHASVRSETKDVRVEARVPKGLLARADPRHILVILRNLTANAVKYTPRGGTVVVTGAEEHGRVVLRVQDTGKGMNAEEILNLQSPERRITSTPGTEGESGNGLGFVLCREFAERCGGRLDIRSAPGVGTTVTLQLPRADMPAEGLPSIPAAARPRLLAA